MSLNPSVIATEPTTVEVLPAQTTVMTWDVRNDDVLTIQLENLDGSQTFAGTVQRRLSDDVGWSDTSLGDFASVAAAGSAVADCDVRGTRGLRLVGTMSGAGGDVRVTAVRRGANR